MNSLFHHRVQGDQACHDRPGRGGKHFTKTIEMQMLPVRISCC